MPFRVKKISFVSAIIPVIFAQKQNRSCWRCQVPFKPRWEPLLRNSLFPPSFVQAFCSSLPKQEQFLPSQKFGAVQNLLYSVDKKLFLDLSIIPQLHLRASVVPSCICRRQATEGRQGGRKEISSRRDSKERLAACWEMGLKRALQSSTGKRLPLFFCPGAAKIPPQFGLTSPSHPSGPPSGPKKETQAAGPLSVETPRWCGLKTYYVKLTWTQEDLLCFLGKSTEMCLLGFLFPQDLLHRV